ncbi:MAG: hypothetical protein CL920_32415 [Deltaproteobacteria bacterium]|nr:hypothetical protein [Deltaproteobacteria bacterium]MBU53424.1 hypothetical protein [Deltaproteobacteria bacterium]
MSLFDDRREAEHRRYAVSWGLGLNQPQSDIDDSIAQYSGSSRSKSKGQSHRVLCLVITANKNGLTDTASSATIPKSKKSKDLSLMVVDVSMLMLHPGHRIAG